MFNIEFPDEQFRKMFDQLESMADDFEKEFLEPALKEAAEPVKKKMESNIQAAANKGYATGQSARNVKASLVKKKKVINGIAIYPRGYDKPQGRDTKSNTKGEDLTNMDKVCMIEFGSSKQSPHPVMQPAFADSKNEVEAIFMKKFEEYAKKKGVM